jgi:hypothetical protein
MSKVKVLILASFAAFALSAIASSSAQAGWLVLGSLLVGSAAISPSTIVHKKGVLQYSTVTIECGGLTINKGEIHEPDWVLINSLEFTGCSVAEPSTCKLAKQPNGVIGTVPVEGLVTLDGPLAVKAKGKPKTGEIFATFKFEGETCSISGKQGVTGTAVILSPEGQDERLWHLVNALTAEAGELKVGEAPATISGSALVKLENDMLWSFD